MTRTLVLGTLFCAACIRAPAHIAPAPSFLHETSGLYEISLVDSATGKSAGKSTVVEVVRVGDNILFALPTDASRERTETMLGTIDRSSGKEVLRVSIKGADVGITEFERIEFAFDIGFDSIRGSRRSIPPVGSKEKEVNEDGIFTLRKACDFDARLAGVFDTQVTKLSESGNCTGADDLSGQRSWGFTVGNARDTSALISLKNGVFEFGARLIFNSVTQKATLREPLKVGTTRWADGSSIDAIASRNDNLTKLDTTFTRVSARGCTQKYNAKSVRVAGTQPGVSCPLESPKTCNVNVVDCPLADAAVDARFVVAPPSDAASSQPSNEETDSCPRQQCFAEVSPRNLCDAESRQIAATGCPAEKGLLVVTTEKRAGNSKCVRLSCEPDPNPPPAGAPKTAKGIDACERPAVASFRLDANQRYQVSCESTQSGCERAPPCPQSGKIAAAFIPADTAPEGCAQLWCQLVKGGSTTFADDARKIFAAAGDEAGYLNAKAALSPTPYVIASWNTTSDGHLDFPVTVDGSSASCPPLDLELLQGNTLVLYRSSGVPCFGIINGQNGSQVSGFADLKPAAP